MLSFDDIKGLVRARLQAEHPGSNYVWLRDVFADCVVYNIENSTGATEPGGGVYYRRTYSIATNKDNTVTITLGACESVTPSTDYQTVASFSLTEFSDAGEFVTWKGKIFEAGSYPDKGVEFGNADLLNAAARFNPVKNDLEHIPTILSGELGGLDRVEARDGGTWLYGELSIPKWLDDINRANGVTSLPVSLAFDHSKQIVGNALTLNPRIKDAQVAAAFAEFAGKRNSTKDSADLQKAHDLMVTLGAVCGSKYTVTSSKEKKPMTLKSALAAIAAVFSGGGDIDPDAELGGAATSAAPQTNTAFSAETQALRDELAKARSAQILSEAAMFTDKLVADRRILPSQVGAIQTQFCTAAQDDLKAGGAKFSEAGAFEPGVRTKACMDAWNAAAQHTLTQEQLNSANASVVFASSEGKAAPSIDAKGIYDSRAKAAGSK